MPSGPPLRAALLGCGAFAHIHARNLASLPGEVELVAFCDRNEPKARAFSEQYTAGRALVFTHQPALFEQAALDLLVVCLPPYGHADEVEQAAARGVHLLVEKPIALASEHAWRMVRAAEAAGIHTQVGFMFRFGEAVEYLKGLLDGGEAGPAGLMAARYFCNSLHAAWWRDRARSGGQLVEQLIHLLDLQRYLLGEPLAVYSQQANRFHRDLPDYTAEDVSATVITFQSGALGVLAATNGAIPDRWISDYRVVAQRLTAEFANANQAVFHFTAQPGTPTQAIAGDRNLHLAELLDLITAIRTGRRTRTPLREGALSLDLALAARRSADTGLPALLPQARLPSPGGTVADRVGGEGE
jgi:predicted dehydrogenase